MRDTSLMTAPSQQKTEHQKREKAQDSRTSYLELEILFNEKNPLRGFFTLFWVVMGFFLLQNIILSLRNTGSFLGKITFDFMSKYVIELFISDVKMLLSASMAFPLQFFISKDLLPSRKVQYTVQTILEVTFLIFWACWIYSRDWYLIQRASLSIHTIVSLMKMHSYNSMNQEYYYILKAYQKIKASIPEGKIEFLKEIELKSKFSSLSLASVYPNNIGFRNYFDFLLVPSLVYELEYPRIEKFRPSYFFSKVLALLGTLGLSYIAVEHHLFPIFISIKDFTALELVIKLAIPFTIVHLLIFFILFEVVCNAFAELTRLADRNFYDDWWNSHNFLEYSSKWNKPVYRFLRRHVFQSLIDTFGISKRLALILTFLVSSIFHELVMCITFQKCTLIFFSFQMFQIPLISFMQLQPITDRPWLGNAIVWVGLCSGIPILSLLYIS